MPSKVMLQAAYDYYRRHTLQELGIRGAEQLELDFPAAMERVRRLRDRFVGGILERIDRIGDRNIEGYAKFVEPDTLVVGDTRIRADSIVIATGSRPFVPDAWNDYGDSILTSDTIFEMTEQPASLGVIGAGPMGLELGQAMSRFGCEVTLVDALSSIGGLSDPIVTEAAISIFSDEMNLELGQKANVSPAENGLSVSWGENSVRVERVLATMGRKPNVESLDLENIGVPLNEKGLPEVDPTTMQIGDLPIFMAGDVNGERPLLHEAIDEGIVAGYNAVRREPHCFRRRVPLAIVFCKPNIALVGKTFKEIKDLPHITGEDSFESQGRPLISGTDKGIIRIYAGAEDGTLLGAELIGPDGEHLVHLLALALQHSMTVFEMLHMPFYHPVVEEILAGALRELASKVKHPSRTLELPPCDEILVK
jgi:dihydrolipoamide dehydrogenase